MDRYIAFDIETPNCRNDRMSSIGIAVVERGRIVDTFTSLVDPETWFDGFNIALTGITPELAASAPTFEELWRVIGTTMLSGTLIAHNAPFDMSVLAKCLAAYCIEAPRYLDYACTVQMGRRVYPLLDNHRLDTMCGHLGIPLDHHRADSDSIACAKLLIGYEEKGLVAVDFIRRYDLLLRRSSRRQQPCLPRPFDPHERLYT